MNPDDQRTSCPGFLDDYGIWNNGFECPIISDQIRVCCGTDSRRYCCSLNRDEKSSLSINETRYSFIEKINLSFLTVPILLTCILLIILLLICLIILILCYYYRKRNKIQHDEHASTKQTLHVDHFPFTPPHHQLVFNENNPQTISTSSSLSARIPSDIYSNDWKNFFTSIEQSMNIYPTVSTNNNDHIYLHSNYLLHEQNQQEDIIV